MDIGRGGSRYEMEAIVDQQERDVVTADQLVFCLTIICYHSATLKAQVILAPCVKRGKPLSR